MLGKRYLQAGGVVAFAVLAAGCSAPIIAETTTGSVEQPEETTSTETQDSVLEEGGRVSAGEGSGSRTAVGITKTDSPTLEYSLAWMESRALEPLLGEDSLKSTKAINNYMLTNPNDSSIPMGALCWAFHELYRTSTIDMMRWQLDNYLIPHLMESHGVSSEQIGNPGPEATEAFLDLVSGEPGSVGSVDDGTGGQTVVPGKNEDAEPVRSTGEANDRSDGDSWETIRLWNEFAGDGTAWSNAVRAIASPEMSAAFRADEGLAPDVQVYADALVAFARERVGRELDLLTESDDYTLGNQAFRGLPLSWRQPSITKIASGH